MQDIPKAYNPKDYEDEIYQKWEKGGYFNPDKLPGKRKKTFSIVMPPPNATGVLHLGHAVMLALEDIMARYERMRGKKTLWLPGTDHAAIATQTVVEKKLKKEKGLRRQDLGREKFLEEVEKFVTASRERIRLQIKKMGASCDWSREAYTLDDARSLAVRTAFKTLYDLGLIYRGNRIVNWCPRCQSTLADDEVEYEERPGKLYYIKYNLIPLPEVQDSSFKIQDFLTVATTRPETKLGDTALAVNPNDKRYQKYIDKEFDVDLAGHKIQIKVIGDSMVDAAFGTGVVGVTPAHSMIDFEMAQKHNLKTRQVIGEDGKMLEQAGKYVGLNVKEAREQLVRDLENAGLLVRIEDYRLNLSKCYRCESAIEPLPKLQWFIDVEKPFKFRQSKRAPIKGAKNGQEVTLKFLMKHVVESGQIKIIPEYFIKTYFQWINNLRDWCISRQIWFGHRIPVFYKKRVISNFQFPISNHGMASPQIKEDIFVGDNPPGKDWVQDEDTLDTWFSSGLWTFSTLGWPVERMNERTNEQKNKSDLARFYPTSVLETGYDILFFWIARMILMTTSILGEIPFRAVYLHGLVRDMQGRKMSKSLGNVIDPLDMIEKYGADAVRIALFIGTSAGTDVKLNEQKIAGYRNFANKIWNASRFVMMNLDPSGAAEKNLPKKPAKLNESDKKNLKELKTIVKEATDCLNKFDFNHAGGTAYHYFWHTFCDKIIEEQKLRLKNEKERPAAQYLLYTILAACLKLLHPFMPFVTEAVWQNLPAKKKTMLIVEKWPL